MSSLAAAARLSATTPVRPGSSPVRGSIAATAGLAPLIPPEDVYIVTDLLEGVGGYAGLSGFYEETERQE